KMVSADAGIRMWDIRKGKQVHFFDKMEHPVVRLAISADGKRMLAADEGGTWWNWDLVTRTLSSRHTDPRSRDTRFAFLPGSRQVLWADSNRVIHLYDLKDVRTVRELKGHTTEVKDVAVSADGKRAFSCSGTTGYVGGQPVHRQCEGRVWELP